MRNAGNGDKVQYVVSWYDSTSTNDRSSRLSKFSNQSFTAIGLDWREVSKCDNNVYEGTQTEEEKYRRSEHWIDKWNVKDKI